MSRESLRSIPSVDRVLNAIGECDLPRPIVVACIRDTLKELRRATHPHTHDDVVALVRENLEGLRRLRIQSVINGTGILVHTNLGRAPLGQLVVAAQNDVATHYCNLEYDLPTGKRGRRAAYLEHALAILCKAEAATVVNNNAAALVLILQHLCQGNRPQVVISRGELIQIGGGFRIPEILQTSGAELVEVGTTNKTSLEDYERAVGASTGMILKVHRSNFFMDGFVSSPTTEELAALAKRKRIPLVEDLGSGAIVGTDEHAQVEHEPTPAEVLRHGVQLVCFSGDKLLGGPQAGIIAGRKRFVSGLKRHPLYRALRCDKLILAGLQAIVELYLEGNAGYAQHDGIPVIAMLATPVEHLRSRAEALIETLECKTLDISIRETEAQIGGGALPRSSIPSIALDIKPRSESVKTFAEGLRNSMPAVIGYVSGKSLRIDLRTVFPFQDHQLIDLLRNSATRERQVKDA
jgi:L-seryl-tRNA(Ser) seleniumtransferase